MQKNNSCEANILAFFLEKNFENSRRFSNHEYSNIPLQKFLQRIKNPQTQFKTIHVAGTNGKGSSSIFLMRLLQNQFGKVGLYSSPHLHTIHERFQINEKKISEAELCQLWQILKKHEDLTLLSYFDTLTALAFLWFERQGVDIAVIETGLGGRLDSTNIIEPLCTILTPIGLDHQNILGNTLEKVVLEKAGIIKKNSQNFSFPQKKKTENILKSYCQKNNLAIEFVASEKYKQFIKEGNFLKANFHVVLQIFLKVFQPNIHNQDWKLLEKKSFSTFLPARLQWLRQDFLFDSAHNKEAVKNLVAWLLANGKKTKWIILFNVMKERKLKDLLLPFKKILNQIRCDFYLLEVPQISGQYYSHIDVKKTKDLPIKVCFFQEKVTKINLNTLLTVLRKNQKPEIPINFLFFGSMRFYSFLTKELQR